MPKFEQSSKRFCNPYHFVPLGNGVTERKDFIERNQRGHEETLTGWLDCELKTVSPLFIPNTTNNDYFRLRVKNNNNIDEPHSYEFFSHTDLEGVDGSKQKGPSDPVIPGSSIRGVIRSAYEALTNSCMSTVDDEHFLYKRFTVPYSQCGVILEQNGKYVLQPCREVSGSTNVDNRQTFRFQGEVGIKKNKKTGKPHQSKKVFEVENGSEPIFLDEEDLRRFRKVIELYRDPRINGNASRRKWYPHINPQNLHGTAVFYEYKVEQLYISPAQIGKEVFYHTLSGLIGSYSPCRTLKSVCPACELFGFAGREEALASRLRFSDAKVVAKPQYIEPGILPELASPKSSATEFYLQKQNDHHDIWNYDYAGEWVQNNEPNGPKKSLQYDEQYVPHISGRKYYWHNSARPEIFIHERPSKRNVKVRPMAKGVTFRFRLHFNRITLSDLRKLTWVLTIGQSQEHAHKLGMGKPVGLGGVQIKVKHVWQRSLGFDSGSLEHGLKDISTRLLDGLEEEEMPCEEDVKEHFLAITNYVRCPNETAYPSNVGRDGKHYEWFAANKTDNFHPVIRQNFTDAPMGSPLYKFQNQNPPPKKQHAGKK